MQRWNISFPNNEEPFMKKNKKKQKTKTLMLGKIEGRRRKGLQKIRWLDGHEFEQGPGDSEGQGSLECCSSWVCKESDMTE